MIRFAEEEDLERCIEMGRRFRSASTYCGQLPENLEQMRTFARFLIKGGSLLVSEQGGTVTGMIGFVIFPHFLSGEMVAVESFWYTEPERRGDGPRLLRKAEGLAKERGAIRMQMIAPNEHVGHFYERSGYEYVESSYQKTL